MLQFSKINQFGGNFVNAICPKCGNKFKPNDKEFIECLYLKQLQSKKFDEDDSVIS